MPKTYSKAFVSLICYIVKSFVCTFYINKYIGADKVVPTTNYEYSFPPIFHFIIHSPGKILPNKISTVNPSGQTF